MSVVLTLDELDLTQMIMEGETEHGNLAVRLHGAAPAFLLRRSVRVESIRRSNVVVRVVDPIDCDALSRLHDALVVLLVNTMPHATHAQVTDSLAHMIDRCEDGIHLVAMFTDRVSRVHSVDADGVAHSVDVSALRVGATVHVVFHLAAMALNVERAQMVPCVIAHDVVMKRTP